MLSPADRMAKIRSMIKWVVVLSVVFLAGSSYLILNSYATTRAAERAALAKAQEARLEEENFDKIENGIHIRTGLVDAEGLMTVVSNCTTCHSAKLLTQNRMTAEGWNETIKWMQEKQGLWDLGDNQEVIVNYLVTNYPYKKKGRRPRLENIEWYELKL